MIEIKIRYIIARIRNIIYYVLEVDKNDPTRQRAQYLHVLRNLRKDLLDLLGELSKMDTRRFWFNSIVNLIDPKIKSEFCIETVRRIKEFVNKEGYVKPAETD